MNNEYVVEYVEGLYVKEYWKHRGYAGSLTSDIEKALVMEYDEARHLAEIYVGRMVQVGL